MIRLHITTEGSTELRFAKTVLAPHLGVFDIVVDSRSVLTSKDNRFSKEYRGGLKHYEKAKQDILTWMKQDYHSECRFTTMFDLYALPKDFPGYDEAENQQDPYERIRLLEKKMEVDIGSVNFIPYIQLYEFEALILAEPQKLDWEYLEHETPIKNLADMVGGQNPELINDGPETAPSKRILKEIPEYDKPTGGVAVAEKIGLQTIREKCRHFDEWVLRLEDLAGTNP
ncbi:MAG: DUF4276 family protein [Deltaproteobacteria bacterium]|jgi:hypothetical protein|nr:DUF4276 family protein [Deltaproteobacteria bacterium]